jgi:hypothetical protein
MDNRPDLKQYYGNKANWKKKKVKRQHSSCSSAHENQKEVSVEEHIKRVKLGVPGTSRSKVKLKTQTPNFRRKCANQKRPKRAVDTSFEVRKFNFLAKIATEKKSFDSSSQLRFDSHKKRAGTTDLGKNCEKLMCALFALKFSTSDIVADFEMKTNSDDFGDFDNVSLKVTFVDGQSQIFLLQLKHSEKMKNVTGSMLAKKKGFSILKYKESIPKFKNTENVSFILYTNSPTSVKNNSKICLQNKDNTITEEVVVRELLDLDPQKHLLINRKEISDKKEEIKVFQFESNQSSGLYNGHDDFWKRFYFFTLQTGTTGAEKLIDSMLKEKCGINDAVYSSSFIQFMETWRSGNFILTKYDVVAKLAELALTPLRQTISDNMCNN